MTVQTKIKAAPGRTSEFSTERIRSLSERVYRERLGLGEAEKMIAKDGDNGEQLRERSIAYDSMTRSYLRAMEVGQ